jgi:glycosyltransferase involved in cell wall biosynthesis
MFPKVLIFGQPFNNYSGGGITLTNLFKGWPKDKIAVTYIGHGLFNATTDVCDTYYQLGKEEHKWKFPFNLFQRKFPSGLKSFEEKAEVPINFIQTGIRYRLVNRVFYPLLRWMGLFHFATRISISDRLMNWISEFKPEILYLQVTARDEINFAEELISYLKRPSIIHIMDDWPSTISKKGLFKKYWSEKIDKEFRALLDRVDLHLSISDAMSVEYKKRYNKDFVAFHNPIETEVWMPFKKSRFTLDSEHITILYSGRIGFGITDSLFEIAKAIDSINNEGFNIKLHIQTPTKDPKILNQLRRFNSVVINPFASLGSLPKIFSGADILLLANDFSVHGVDYLRFSMPTKAPEYMISGAPVLVYSAEETAVSKFFSKNNCGLCVTKQGPEEITKALKFMLNNEEYRKEISKNAFNLAEEKFDANHIRKEFQNLLINLL